MCSRKKRKIWIDLDNTPHVPFFKPISEELQKHGYGVVITARDAYQVIDLAGRFGLKYIRVGRHFGKNKALKVLGTLLRALQMMSIMKKQSPELAISHGSRSQLIAASLLRIPTVMLYDYEHSKGYALIKPTYVMAPEVIPPESLHGWRRTFFTYPGIKEDVYVQSFVPDPSIKKEVGIDDRALVVTIRPPATEAHYFCAESERLFESAMSFLLQKPETQLIVMPRNGRQEEFLRTKWAQAYREGKMIIPKHAINGLDLMWFSDLVISGGGTMNREGAALGVPVYSIFRGAMGAIDLYLAQNGRLVLLESADDLEKKLVLAKRDSNHRLDGNSKPALRTIVDKVIEILEKHEDVEMCNTGQENR